MLAIVAILALGMTIGQSTAQVFTDKNGNTYEVIIDQGPTQQRPQQYYPQQQRPHYPQRQQQRPYYPQQQFPNRYTPQANNQQGPGVSVANAEWVCTNSRTKDIMIIAGNDNPGTRLNVPVNNQPSQPTFAKPPPGELTYPNVGQNVISTTQRPSGPFWPDFETTTTAKPVWPGGNSGKDKPGLIVVEPEPLTTSRPITTRRTTTQAPPNNGNDDDDDEPIKIDFGK